MQYLLPKWKSPPALYPWWAVVCLPLMFMRRALLPLWSCNQHAAEESPLVVLLPYAKGQPTTVGNYHFIWASSSSSSFHVPGGANEKGGTAIIIIIITSLLITILSYPLLGTVESPCCLEGTHFVFVCKSPSSLSVGAQQAGREATRRALTSMLSSPGKVRRLDQEKEATWE